MKGSSPHTRGARTRGPPPSKSSGIIPAYAGSTRSCPARRPPASDHPRIRGEHGVLLLSGCLVPGSSPHTRGARVCRCPGRPGRGIIPAYAGSTHEDLRRLQVDRHHPRIRGEHAPSRIRLGKSIGSSPHTRGAPRRRRPRGGPGRIIPAYAGSTAATAVKQTPLGDHPRIRGEHYRWRRFCISGLGSSPHTRGAPRHA